MLSLNDPKFIWKACYERFVYCHFNFNSTYESKKAFIYAATIGHKVITSEFYNKNTFKKVNKYLIILFKNNLIQAENIMSLSYLMYRYYFFVFIIV